MDLKNNRITIGEIIKNPRAKYIIDRNFPIMMNPFLLQVALKMSLENILKLASGPYAQDQRNKVIFDLESI